MGIRVRATALAAVTMTGVLSPAGSAATAATVRAAAPAPALAYDFDGDGFPDQALGSPLGTASGAAGAGFVTVVRGGPDGPDPATRQLVTQPGDTLSGGPEPGDGFGNALASADLDRDGFADLVVGTPGEDVPQGVDAGVVTVIWGGPDGLGIGSGTWVEHEAGAGHRFGDAVTIGSFRGPTAPDMLIVTSPGTSSFAGYTFALPTVAGKAPAASARTAKAARTPKAGERRTVDPREAADARTAPGAAAAVGMDALYLAGGDVTGDGHDDLAVGWRDEDAEINRYGFTVYLGDSVDEFKDTAGGDITTPLRALAVADYNGNGKADVAAGLSTDSPQRGGAVAVYRGGAEITPDNRYTVHQGTAGVPGDGETGDAFGQALASGDANGDGLADLLVGVPGEDIGGRADAGSATLLYGGTGGVRPGVAQGWHQDSTGVPGTAEARDRFGWSVGLVDHDPSGPYDATIGAPTENGTDGAVTVLLGAAPVVTAAGAGTYGAATLGVGGRNARIGLRVGRVG